MKALVFDVDDTLYDRRIPFERAYRELYSEKYDVSVEKLYWATTRRGDEVFEAAQTGRMDMGAAHIYRFREGFADLGIVITDDEAMTLRYAYERKQKEIEMSPLMKELLEFCAQKQVPMGIITNGSEDHQRGKIKQLGAEKWIPAERIVISAVCGIRKPDQRIFEYMQKKMDMEAYEFYYIGDSYANDIPGAVKAGWKTIWLNKQQIPFPQGEAKPDHIVKNEKELDICVRALLDEMQ